MDKSPKVGREYEKPDFIALALLDVMRCLINTVSFIRALSSIPHAEKHPHFQQF
jgi:hypothetical protein